MTRFETLLDGYRKDLLTREELQEFFLLLPSNIDAVDNRIMEELHFPETEESFLPFQRERVLGNVLSQIKTDKQRKTISLWKRVTAAAAIIVVAGSGYLFTQQQNSRHIAAISETKEKQDVAAGRDKALLTLANGQQIDLDSLQNGTVPTQSGSLQKLSTGHLVIAASKGDVVGYNTISIPRGGQFHLTLPDGTDVWLNSSSSLRFPTAFNGKQRNVTLEGEGYFEVAKNRAQPFVVAVNDATIQVLGTHFNIMAYSDEAALETTLLEGSVKFNKGDKAMMLKPGQQSRLKHSGELDLVSHADVSLITAWKTGMQAFKQAPITEIMRQVSRWYDVEVVYQSSPPGDMTFTGEIPRGVNLSQLLRLFENKNLHFRIDQDKRTVTVTQ